MSATATQRFIVHCPTIDLAAFEAMAREAARLKPHGEVLVVVSELAGKGFHEIPPGGSGFRVGEAWVQTPMLTDQPRVTVVPEQGKAMQFEDTDLSFPSAACVSDEGLLSSNTLAVVSEEGCAWPREAWIITFDDVPA